MLSYDDIDKDFVVSKTFFDKSKSSQFYYASLVFLSLELSMPLME